VSPVLVIALLWLGFALTHIGMSSARFRPRLVAMLGDRGFQGAYSLVALAFFVPLCIAYFRHKHAGPLLWSVPLVPPLYWLVYVGMGLAFVLLFAGLLTPSPTAMNAARGEGPLEPRGIHYITRHAVFMAMGLFGALHLIPNGFAADVAFFGGFVVFVVVGSIHQDRRKLASDGARYRPFWEQTALLPFTGPHTLRGLRELPWLAVALGIGAAVVVRHFHARWFGG